jgi:hypothetical protein
LLPPFFVASTEAEKPMNRDMQEVGGGVEAKYEQSKYRANL